MKNNKNDKKNKKPLIITLVTVGVIAVLAAVGQFVVRPLVVNFAFGQITSTVMETMSNNAQSTETPPAEEPSAEEQQPEEQPEQTEKTEEEIRQEKIEKRRKEVDSMSVNQVAAVVAADSGLIAQLEKIVSPADKEKVLSILLSNFSKEEIAKYSAEVAAGITAKRKSELASMAKSRLTSAQWAQCMQLFSKYVDQLRPIIAEKVKD